MHQIAVERLKVPSLFKNISPFGSAICERGTVPINMQPAAHPHIGCQIAEAYLSALVGPLLSACLIVDPLGIYTAIRGATASPSGDMLGDDRAPKVNYIGSNSFGVI
jgi:hypothetical protein